MSAVRRHIFAARAGDLPAGRPEWLHLVPWGRYLGHWSGLEIEIGDAQGREIVANFARSGIDLVVDYEHQTVWSLQNGKPAPAAGWIDRLEVRPDGVWGHIREWTEAAGAMLDAREYRYLSPVIEPAAVDRVSAEPTGMCVSSVALTNVPFFAGDLRPVVAKGVSPMNLLALLIPILELPETASEQDVVDKVTQLKAASGGGDAAMAAKAELGAAVCQHMGWTKKIPNDAGKKLTAALTAPKGVSEKDHLKVLTELEQLKNGRGDVAAEQLVARGIEAGKIPPALKDRYLALAKNDPAAARELIDESPVHVPLGPPAARTADPAGGGAERPLTTGQKLAAKRLGMTEDEYRKGLKPQTTKGGK